MGNQVASISGLTGKKKAAGRSRSRRPASRRGLPMI